MIQTKFPVIYGDRDERKGVIMLEVRPMDMTELGTNYLVIDWDVSKNPPEAWKSKTVFYDKDKINQLDEYLENNHNFEGMTKVEKEFEKIKLSLMLDTQTNLLDSNKTIYGINPDDWEYVRVEV